MPAWELSLGLDVESVGLISFGLFMRMFLAHKGVTPYTISVLLFLQSAAAVIAALFFPAIRRFCQDGYVLMLCVVGKIVFAAVFLFVVLKQTYQSEIEDAVVIITHDAIFIDLESVLPQDNTILTATIMVSSVLLAMFCQVDTLSSNQIIQESILDGNRGQYASAECSFKYIFTLIKQMCIACIAFESLFMVLLVLTFVCELVKLFLVVKETVEVEKRASCVMIEEGGMSRSYPVDSIIQFTQFHISSDPPSSKMFKILVAVSVVLCVASALPAKRSVDMDDDDM
eukprot:sb/3467768/